VSFAATGSNDIGDLEYAKKKFEYTDNKLNLVYKRLISKYPETSDADLLNRKKNLIDSERAWLKYRDTYCKFLNGYSSASPEDRDIIYEDCRTYITEARIEELFSRDLDKIYLNAVSSTREDIDAKMRKLIKKNIIHPKIFDMIQCWTIDGNYPVMTELNMDALHNRNQFDYGDVKINSEWISFRDRYGVLFRYKFINKDKDKKKYKVLFTHNSGASAAEAWEIEYEINNRKIMIDNKTEKIDTLKVISIKLVSLK
jgi:uncharacterized protein YecT (DUF1311 family)